MIGTITYILARAGWRAMNGQLTDERRRLAGAEPPAAYVSYDPRLLAGVGWYGYRIAFKGGDRQMIDRARYMLSERYTIRDSYEYYADGVYVIGVLLRQRVPHYGIGGGAPTPDTTDYLNFTMPNGGTVTLTRTGSPTVVDLEYSLDDRQTWTDWQEVGNVRTLTLTAGQRVYVRNTSETSTGFSTGLNHYNFEFTADTYVGGNTNSLLCKTPSNASLTDYCYYSLFLNCINLTMSNTFTLPSTTLANGCYNSMFNGCTNLTMSDTFALPATTVNAGCYSSMFRDCTSLTMNSTFTLPATTLANSCYSYMFFGCTNLTIGDTFTLPATTLSDNCYSYMFYGCINFNLMRTNMIDISANNCLSVWLYNTSTTGDFYCPAELTIPTGISGIPSGWTRHDI